jgi:hypothetical protein
MFELGTRGEQGVARDMTGAGVAGEFEFATVKIRVRDAKEKLSSDCSASRIVHRP